MSPELAKRYAEQFKGVKQANLKGALTTDLGYKKVNSSKVLTPRPGAVEQVVQKVGDVARQTASVTGAVAGTAGKFVANTPKYIKEDLSPFLQGMARTITGDLSRDISNINKNQTALEDNMKTITSAYKSGQMSKENYQKAMRGISAEYSELSKRAQGVASKADRGNVVESAAMTAFDILSVGQLELGRVAGKQAVQMGTKEGVKALVRVGATRLETQMLRVPAVRQLVERNLIASAKRLASETTEQFIRREGQHIAAGLLIKRPIFYQSNLGDAKKVYEGILTGNYPQAIRSAAWLGSQMLEGGPIGVFFKGGGWLKGKLGDLSYGKGSFVDELSKRIGDGNPSQVARFLTTAQQRAPDEGRKIEKAFRIFQESNLRVTSDNVPEAVTNFLRTYTDAGIDLANVTPSQIYKDMDNWRQADELWNSAAKGGKLKMAIEDAGKFTPVRWDSATRNAVANLKSWDEVLELSNQPGAGFSNNNNLMLQLERIFKENAGDAKAINKAIRSIDAAMVTPQYIPKALSNQLAKLGYTMAEPVGGRAVPFLELDDTRKLVSGAVNNAAVFDPAVAPLPSFQAVAGALEQAGVSPRASNQYATRKLGESVAANIDGTPVAKYFGFTAKNGDQAKGGQAILSKLQQYVENKRASRIPGLAQISAGKSSVTDIRQLTTKEIQQALGSVKNGKLVPLDSGDAKEIYRAIIKGYQDVPLEYRGLGDRIVDNLYAYNPLQRYYSRIQSAMRYTYNPFFRLQENTETAILSRAQANNLIWGKTRGELDDAVKLLDDKRIFSGVLPGEAANDQVLGRITANLTGGQKRDLAGLALDVANTKGMTLEKLATEFPEDIDDVLRVVVQYPRKGILASPLARTINLAFFPMRYNTKVTMLAAQTLAKQPPSIQKAVLHSAFRMREWLKSDEGIRWQSQNADAIQLFKWVTPVGSIESTFKLLTGSANSLGEIGQLGGLPLGFITQILDGQGIINLNKPYVNPKTGDVFPDYIPQTAKARAATALGDLLNTMFTYPGRIVGLPGKEQTIRTVVKKLIETEGKDFEKRLDMNDLTPLQQNWVRVLKGDTSKEAIDALYTSPAEGQFNWYTLPPLSLPYKVQPVIPKAQGLKKRTGLPSKKKSGAASGPKPKTVALPLPGR